MREGTRLWKNTITQVRVLLSELDPCGFEPGLPDGAPENEYELEAAPIARQLIRDGLITAEQIDAIWLTWFERTLTEGIGREATDRLVARLNRLVEPNT